MKKYTLDSLREDLTGLTKKDSGWDIDYDKVRNISKCVKSIFCIKNITDENKKQYVRVCKFLYENDDTRLFMNKYSKILERIREIEVIDSVLILPNDLKSLTNEECIKVLEVLVEFFKGTEKGYILTEKLETIKSEEYNAVLAKFEEEVERIKISIQGCEYKDRIAKLKEIQEYLNKNRTAIDKDVNDNFVLPEKAKGGCKIKKPILYHKHIKK